MSTSIWHALIACLISIFILAGCSNTNETGQSVQTESYINENDALPLDSSSSEEQQKKDSVAKGPQYTNHKFASAEEAIAFMQESPDWDKYREGIFPQAATEDLNYTTKLLNSPYKHFIVVDKSKMKVVLFDRYGRVVHDYGMAGPRNFGTKQKKGDCRTPEGYFSAEGVYDSSDWEYIDDNGKRHPGKCFGPRFIRIKNPVTTQVGIHGTSSPGSIGKRTSHGCIRVYNENILQLVKYVERGMPILVLPSKNDMAVNTQAGLYKGWVNTGVAPLASANLGNSQPSKPKEKKTSAEGSETQVTESPEVEQPVTEPAQEPVETPAEPEKTTND